MAQSSPYTITLEAQERQELQRRAAAYTLPYYQVVRARMILYAAQGLSNEEIAQRLDTRRDVISLWRKRFYKQRMAGLEEGSRPGRPRSFSPWADRAGQSAGLRVASHFGGTTVALEHG